eukprot:TRINITY_DN5411_c0_g1_i3.p1 TRINITY_DN5411_c0_g1~~TRINITY_DN5411_c0_g1_i3.p1  ORF type:complete len:845 (+),score=235.92 TRINITY_DN5411_c0_g1_i3:86-2620(+)
MAGCCRNVSWRSTSVLFVVATIANIAFSFVGGLLLYLESLREIERGVEEISEAEVELNGNKLRRSFDDVFWTSENMATTILFNGTKDLTTLEELQRLALAAQLGTLFTSDTMYALAMYVAPLGDPMAESPQAMSQVTWWDPLTDPAAIERNGGPKQWLTSWYLPEFYRGEACRKPNVTYDEVPPNRRRCNTAFKVDQEGVVGESVYSYVGPNLWYLQSGSEPTWNHALKGWEENGATFWRTLSVWNSEDGTKYSYASFVRSLPRLHQAPFIDAQVVVITYVSFYGWFNRIDSDSEATMMAATLADGDDSMVLASNIKLSLLKTDCQTMRGDVSQVSVRAFCQLTIAELPRRFSDAARFLNNTPYNAFRTASLDGEPNWVRRTNIFHSQPNDLLDSIDFLWMREHSTVQEKVKKSLINFVCFVGGSAVLSAIVLTLLVLGISVPLGEITDAMRHLDDMELETAEAELPAASTKQVKEVSVLIVSVEKALKALKMYREFLPQSCLNMGGQEEEGGEGMSQSAVSSRGSAYSGGKKKKSMFGGSVASSRMSKNSSKQTDQEAPGLRQLLGAALEQRTVSVAVLNVVGFHSEDKNVHRQKGLLAVVMQSKLDGVLDGCVGDRTRVSWNGSRTIGTQKVRAAKFVETMRGRPDCAGFRLSLAATAGHAKCGVAGCDGFRYFTLVGPHISFAYVVERLAHSKAAARGASVAVITKPILDDASTAVESRFFMHVKFRKLHSETVLFETTQMCSQDAGGADEWMYELEEMQKSGPWTCFNEAAKLCSGGSVDRAVELLKERPASEQESVNAIYTEFCDAVVQAQKGFGPLPTAVRLVSDISFECSGVKIADL